MDIMGEIPTEEIHDEYKLKELFIQKTKEHNQHKLHGVLSLQTLDSLWSHALKNRFFVWDNFEKECVTSNQLTFKEWFYCEKPNTIVIYKEQLNQSLSLSHQANHFHLIENLQITPESCKQYLHNFLNEGKIKIEETTWIIILNELDYFYSDEFWSYYNKQCIRDSKLYFWKNNPKCISYLFQPLDIDTFEYLFRKTYDLTSFSVKENEFYNQVKKAYVLCVHSEQRSELIKQQLDSFGYSTDIIYLTDDDKLAMNNLLSMFPNFYQKYSIFNIDLKKLILFTKIHKKEFFQSRNVFVLYDDVVFCKNFQQKLEEMLHNSRSIDWDCIFLNQRFQKLNIAVTEYLIHPLANNDKPFDGILIKSKTIKSIVSAFELSPNLYVENPFMSFKSIKSFVSNYNFVTLLSYPQLSLASDMGYEDSVNYFYDEIDYTYYNQIEISEQPRKGKDDTAYKTCVRNKFEVSVDNTALKNIFKINLIDKSNLSDDERRTYSIYETAWTRQHQGCALENYSINDILQYRNNTFPRWENVIAKTRHLNFITILFGYLKVYENGGVFVFDNNMCHTSMDGLFSLKCQAVLCLKQFPSEDEHKFAIEPKFLVAKRHSEFVRALIYHIIHYFHLLLNYSKTIENIDAKLDRIITRAMTNVFYKYWFNEKKDIMLLEEGHYQGGNNIRYNMLISDVPTPLPSHLVIHSGISSAELDIFLLVKNNANFLHNHFWKMMGNVERSMRTVKFNYYIYENDSVDNTVDIIEKQKKQRNIKFISKRLGDLNKTIRTYRLGIIRNELTDCILEDAQKRKSLSDMVLMIDTDVVFSSTTIHKMIHALLNKKDAIMVGSHCLGLDGGYYDSLALEMGKYHLDRQTFVSHIVNYPFDLYPVSSCFGGICLTYKYVFNYCHYGQDTSTLCGYYSNMTCEHYNFCRNLKSFGNIYICKSAISYWVQNWLTESRQLLEKLKLNGFYT